MIYAVVTALLAVAGSFVWAMRVLGKAKDETVLLVQRMSDERHVSDERIAALRAERDDWKVKHDLAVQERAAEKVLRIAAEQQRNEAASKERAHVVAQIKSSTAADAARIAAAVVSSPLPKVPRAAHAAAASSGPGRADRVQPPGPPKLDPIRTLK